MAASHNRDSEILPPQKPKWVLTQTAFDQLLDWLDPDREKAGKKYENIRRKLIRILACKGSSAAEDLADEAINRVAKRVAEIAPTYVGEPALYFFGVAQNVFLESVKKPPFTPTPPPPDPAEEVERRHQCLESCMRRLPADSREMIREYYAATERVMIDHRKRLAERLGIAPNALRIRVHRLRAALKECTLKCLRDGEQRRRTF